MLYPVELWVQLWDGGGFDAIAVFVRSIVTDWDRFGKGPERWRFFGWGGCFFQRLIGGWVGY